jgi:hypothetical protein
MPSIFPEFEYDIFISYRHNDNQLDGWVSEFVEKLEMELRATIKGRVHVYFDQSRSEGLQAHHLVGASLDAKVNTAIFMPIVSRTYCDLESYAWKHEFMEFLAINRNSGRSLEVKLPNGNVASRVLPVRIHNLDQEDVQLMENGLGGRLRSIDFVYEFGGVDRPLRLKDDDAHQPGVLIYRNQISKVALAVRDIINSLKHGGNPPAPAPRLPADLPQQAVTRQILASHLRTETNTANDEKPASGKRVFLAWTSSDLKAKREDLLISLGRAGFDVFPNFDCPSSEEEFSAEVEKQLQQADFAMHLFSTEYGRCFEETEESFPAYQYEKGRELSEKGKIRQVIWQCAEPDKPFKSRQEALIRSIRNQLNSYSIFSGAANTMQLVDELRNYLQAETPKKQAADISTEIFFIYNRQDFSEAEEITDFLSAEIPLEVLMIEPNTETLYRERTLQQLPETRLAVIYFKHSGDWAIPFIKQVWKDIGGAKAPNFFALVGDEIPEINAFRNFKAPKVISRITGGHRIAEEIKNIYQNLQQQDA